MLSVCGVRCSTDCRAHGKECAGCNELAGKVSWAQFYGKDQCPIYGCVRANQHENCKACGKAPCKTWFDTRNPETSDEEFQTDIESRLRNFCSLPQEDPGVLPSSRTG